MSLQTYAQFSPTPFDNKGLNLPDRQTWIVAPVGQTRDSGPFDLSNFAAALDRLGGESETVEVHRFGHWGPGWFEIILVDPSREAEVQAIADDLESYPILNEDDFSNREFEDYCESWESWGSSDFMRGIERKFEDELTEDELERLDEMDLMPLYEAQFPGGGYYTGESDGVYLPIGDAIKSLRIADIRVFIAGESK